MQRGDLRGVRRYSGHDVLIEQGCDFWGVGFYETANA